MPLRNLAHRADRAIILASKVLNICGVAGAAFLMLLVTSDVFLRYFFNHPIPGSLYISQYVLILVVYCSAAYCQILKSHVKMDLFLRKFPIRIQAILNFVTNLVALVLLSLMVWQTGLMAMNSWSGSEVSHDTLRIAIWPFRTVIVVGIAMLCLTILADLVKLVREVKRI